MVLQLAVMNGFEIKYLIEFCKKMLRETKGNSFRFSDTNLTQSEIKKLINLGLLDCTAQLRRKKKYLLEDTKHLIYICMIQTQKGTNY